VLFIRPELPDSTASPILDTSHQTMTLPAAASDQPTAPSVGAVPSSPITTPETAQLRSGPELIAAARAFEGESRWTSWSLLLITLAALALPLSVVVLVDFWLVQLLAGMLAGLVQVRLFIFYHDALHGAIFRRDPIGYVVMTAIGYYLLAVRSVWQETHDYHHQNNAKLVGSAIGSYPVLSVGMLPRVTPSQWRLYRLIRHPLTMLTGLVSIFMVGMVWSAFQRNPRHHWQGLLATALYISAVTATIAYGGWMVGICTLIVPHTVAMAVGSYLFYAQHNFPDIKLAKRATWSFTNAALHSSSMFDMSPMMHWFTGNIGFHHVHHLNHRIPFYRLPETMRAIPELQNPGRTSWRLRDIRACLNLGVWDPHQDRMLTYTEAAPLRIAAAVPAGE